MVKSTFFIYFLAAAAGVDACKRTCTATADSGGKCTYNCTSVCSDLPATEARNNFLSALHSAGYSCTSSGSRGVKCKKTPAFGSCYDHYWSCGGGC